VALGDSITDGHFSTPTPSQLAGAAGGPTGGTEGHGQYRRGQHGDRGQPGAARRDWASALARFDRDVLSQPGVKWVMVLEGINDIGHGTLRPAEMVTADELIAGHKQIIERAHAHGLKAIGCTLTPFEGAYYAKENGEAVREALNTWIRTSGPTMPWSISMPPRMTQQPKRFSPHLRPGRPPAPQRCGLSGHGERRRSFPLRRKRTASKPANVRGPIRTATVYNKSLKKPENVPSVPGFAGARAG